jgi:hypothetical protein
MSKRKTIVVNLFGGPGSGKSTQALGVAYKLKLNGVNCEYASEIAKDLMWREDYGSLKDQVKIFGKQNGKIFDLKDKVDVVITDSPAVMGLLYCDNNDVSVKELKALAIAEFNRDDIINVNIMLKRDPNRDYDPNGREQTADEAKEKDKDVRVLLSELGIRVRHFIAQESTVDYIYTDIMKKLDKILVDTE